MPQYLFFKIILLIAGIALTTCYCPQNWIPTYDRCLLAVLNETTFENAQLECLNLNANVAQAHEKVKNMLFVIADFHEKQFWLDNPSGCSTVASMRIIQSNCSEEFGYICEMPADSRVPSCEGSLYYESNCLTFFRRIKESRELAKLRCSSLGGQLLDITNKFRASIARVTSISVNSSFWIGHTTAADEECMMVYPMDNTDASFSWISGGCSNSTTTASAFCEIPHIQTTTTSPRTTRKTTTTMTTTKLPVKCPEGYNWKFLGDYCYWETSHETDRRNWRASRDFCRQYGGNLVSYSGAQEEVVALSTAKGIRGGMWIGLWHEPGQKDFKWSDGSPVNYTNWAMDQPNFTGRNKLCVAHSGDNSSWEVSYCGIRRWFICKVPMVPNPPSPEIPYKQVPECQDDAKGNWYAFGDDCYMFRSWEGYSWETGRVSCHEYGAELASIHSFDETDFIFDIMNMYSLDPIWIGLRARGLDASFLWSDGSVLNFVNWGEESYFDNGTLDKCVAFNAQSGFWSLQHCNHFLPIICKRKINQMAVDTTSTVKPRLLGFCPDEWYSLGDKCYKHFGIKASDKKTWVNAKKSCDAIESTLATVHSQREQDLLSELVLDAGYAVWIGLYSSIRGSLYHWVDDSIIDYTSWDEGEPFQYGKDEACVEMIYGDNNMGKWNDAYCNSAKAYICQKSKDPKQTMPGKDPSLCKEPLGWYKLSTSCYTIFRGSENHMAWLDAHSHCKKFKAGLTYIGDYGVTGFLRNLMFSDNRTLFWIGVRETRNNTYHSLSNYPFSYANWFPGQPTKVSEMNNCVAIDIRGKWIVRNCDEKLPFICQFSTDHNELAVVEEEGAVCPNTSTQWISIKGPSCFLFVTEKTVTWHNAMHECFTHGGWLASFHSKNQLDSMSPYLKYSNFPVHIGLGRKRDGSYSWVDGTALDFVNWQVGEPNSLDELCVEMHADVLTWNDISCSETRGYICSAQKVYSYPRVDHRGSSKASSLTNEPLGIGSIVAIAVVTLLLVVITASVMYYMFQRRRRRSMTELDTPLKECALGFDDL